MIKLGGLANPEKAEMDKFLDGIVGIVEANSFESSCLWKTYHREMGKPWKSGGGGPMIQVGTITSGDEELPVCAALLVNEVDGHRILFVDVTSRGIDHELVRKWLKENVPVTAFEDNDPRKRLRLEDANNFHAVFPRRREAA